MAASDSSDRNDRSSAGTVWYRLGYALERARNPAPEALRSLKERMPGSSGERKDVGESTSRPVREQNGDGGASKLVDIVLSVGAGSLASRLLRLWRPRHEPRSGDLLRAAVTGAGAAALHRLVRPLLVGEDRIELAELPPELAEAAVTGVARGLVYAYIVEPRLVGATTVRGLVYGALEYAVSPWGGLGRVFRRQAPLGRIPVLSALYEAHDPDEDSFVDHVAFAVALAVLYGGVEDG